VRLQACDQGTPQRCGNAVFYVNINFNLNDPTISTATCGGSLLEIQDLGTPIRTIVAADGDSGMYGAITYILTPVTPGADQHFDINENGQIILNRELVGSGTDTYEFDISLIDGGGKVSPTSLRCSFTVQRNNQTPYFLNLPNSFEIDSTLTQNVNFFRVEGADNDPANTPFGQITYSLISNNLFSINENSGEIRLAGSLPSNANTDGLSPPNNVQSYDIDLSTDVVKACFRVQNNGEIYAKSALYVAPCNVQKQYNITVRATDGGDPRKTSVPVVATLNILRNDFTPTIASALTYTIREDAGFNAPVGTITTQDQDTTLFVTVTDKGPLPKSSSRWVTVNVLRNLYDPAHNETQWRITITEDRAVGSAVLQLTGHDRDTKAPWNQFVYRSEGSSAAEAVFALSSTGLITVKSPLYLDNNRPTTYTLNSRLRDKNGAVDGRSSNLVPVTIEVTRNTCPVFTTIPTPPAIDESFVTQSVVNFGNYMVDNDPNTNIFGQHNYRILGDNNAGAVFSINSNTGEVQTRSAIFSDTDLVYFTSEIGYPLRVEVADQGPSRCSATAVVTVTVNRNLQSPRWTNTLPGTTDQYSNTIDEILSINTAFATISAEDGDSKAPHSEIEYSILTNTELFGVVPGTGSVYLTSSQRNLLANSYTFDIQACDKGEPTPRCITGQFTLSVRRNQFPPEILNLYAELDISESRSLSTTVPNPFDQYSFSAIGDEQVTSFFSINSAGNVFLIAPLENDNTFNSLQMRVEIRDGGFPARTAVGLLKFNILRNQNGPVFEAGNRAYSTDILETQPVGVELKKREMDLQGGDKGILMLRQSMMDYSDTRTLFSVQVFILARDNGVPQNQSPEPATVTVNVRRNTAPFFTNLNSNGKYVQGVDMDLPAGGLVFPTAAQDNDIVSPFNELEYSIIGDEDAMRLFEINTNGQIRIQVEDGGTPRLSDSVTLELFVSKNFNPPVFANNNRAVTVTIQESAPQGYSITRLTATDADVLPPNNQFEFSLEDRVPGSGDSSYVFLHPTTGQLTLTKTVLDAVINNPTDVLQMTAYARDKGEPQLSSSINVDVIVERIEGDLSFAQDYVETINENTNIGTPVVDTRAFPGVVTYSLAEGYDGNLFFKMQANGTITVNADLTKDSVRERPFFDLVAVGKRQEFDIVQTATANVRINILRNLNSPIFSMDTYTVDVWEKDARPINGTRVFASDADGDTVLYTITGGDFFEKFYLYPYTGDFYVLGNIENDSITQYNVDIRASDQRNPANFDTARVIVRVSRDNENPVFTNIPVSIGRPENMDASTGILYNVTAEDADKRYQPIFVHGYQYNFEMELFNTPLLEPNRPCSDLKWSMKLLVFTFVQESQSGLTPEVNIDVHITCLSVQSLTPDFYSLQDVLIWSITDVPSQEYYYINPSTGVITLKKSLMLGAQLSYLLFIGSAHKVTFILDFTLQIQVRVCDDRASFAKCDNAVVTVTIRRNQNPPSFQQLPYQVSLNRNDPAGTFVRQTTALDQDLRGTIVYKKTGRFESTNSFFEIDMSNGTVYTIKDMNLDGLYAQQYLFEIIAYDSAYPLDIATATVTVNVNRNPTGPQFTDLDGLNYLRQIDENHPYGTIVLDDVVMYMKGRGWDAIDLSTFYLDSATGEITLKRILDDANIVSSYTFEVIARDPIPAPLTRSATAQVTIQVVYDSPPVFNAARYVATILETHAVGTEVPAESGDIRAADPDSFSGAIVYSIVGNLRAPYLFAVTNENGRARVTLNSTLMGDPVNAYLLRIEAYDVNYPQKKVYVNFAVNVIRNVNSPVVQSGSATIFDYHSPDEMIFMINNGNHFDNDGDRLLYSMSGQGVPELFDIDSFEGGIYVINSDLLMNNGTTRFVTTVTARDQRNPEKTGQGTVTINVNYDDFAPTITNIGVNGLIEGVITENVDIGLSVARVSARDEDIVQDGEGQIVYVLASAGVGEGYFTLLPSGQINTARSFNTSQRNVFQYELIVHAYDTRYPMRRTPVTVQINVTRNLNGPQFSSGSYQFPIDETIALFTSIGRVEATDLDIMIVRFVQKSLSEQSAQFVPYELLTLDRVTYSASGQFAGSLFMIDPSSGIIYTIGNILNEPSRSSSYTLTVTASDNFQPSSRTSSVNVVIPVTRDIPTRFVQPNAMVLTIAETQPINSTITLGQRIAATDPDLQAPGVITFELIGTSLGAYYFDIRRVSNTTVDVFVRNDLMTGFRTRDRFELTIVAYDPARPRNKAYKQVVIQVNRNQGPPVWTFALDDVLMREDHPVFTSLVTTVSAEDARDNDDITYSIIGEAVNRALSSGASNFFQMDDKNGEVYLTKTVLGTDIIDFNLQIQACDDGVPIRCIDAPLLIIVVRDHFPPSFSFNALDRFVFTLSEQEAPGFLVGQIESTDSSPLGPTIYNVVPPYPEFFTLNMTDGRIILAKSLFDYLDLQYARFMRSFPVYNLMKADNVLINFMLTLIYRKSFSILQFQVTAYDQGEPAFVATGNVIVNVIRNNNGPQFLLGTYQRPPIHETFEVGTMVFNTTAVDVDGDVVRYNLIGDAVDLEYFFVDPFDGIIYVKKSLLNVPTTRFDFVVRARDQRRVNERFATANVIIDVDADSAPIFTSGTSIPTIAETSVAGSTIHRLSARDEDQEGTLIFKLIGVPPAQYMYMVNETTGVISLSRDIKGSGLEKVNQYMLNVVVYDSPYPLNSATQMLTVFVNVNPGTPQFQPNNNYIVRINETESPGFTATSVLATDTDGLTIEANDGRGNSAQAFVRITILRNPDDQRPYFINQDVDNNGNPENYRATIQYDHIVGTNVTIRPAAVDNDLMGQLRYEAVADNVALQFFAINPVTGHVTLTQDLNNDPFRSVLYQLYLEAYDSARPNNRAQELLLITVDRNPNAPIFSGNTDRVTYTINEKEPIGFSIGAVVATDADGDVITYSMQAPITDGTDTFVFLNQRSGQLLVNGNLRDTQLYGNTYQVIITIERDREDPYFSRAGNATINDKVAIDSFVTSVEARDDDLVELELQAYDSFYPNNRATAFIWITVVRNGDTIVFDTNPSYYVEVNEYRKTADEIYRVTAVDPDGDAVRYRIINSPLALEYFYITTEGPNGVLYIKKTLAENQINDTYVFQIEATDARRFFTQYAYVTMTVKVLRNQMPFFTRLPTSATVTETSGVGNTVFEAIAVDTDLLPGSRVNYQIIGNGLAPGFFSIRNPESGIITIASDLRRDMNLQYNVTVIAYDSQLRQMAATSTLTVSVTRNANAPRFTENPYSRSLTWRDLPGTVAVTILATDNDGDVVTYGFGANSADVYEYFGINSVTGNITLLRTLPPRRQSWTINVVAYDNANPEKTAQSQVSLTVGIDAFPPSFQPNNDLIILNTDETRPVGYIIDGVTASDGDRRGEIVYELDGEYPGVSFFDVNRTTGDIYIIRDLKEDVSAREEYTIHIVAYDTLVPENRARKTVIIRVARNQGFPQFERSMYDETVDEFHQLAVSIVNITANDFRDNDAITYMMVDDSIDQLSRQFFYIDRYTGVIYLRKPLTTTNVNTFQFIVRATDDGVPSRTTDVTVILRVIRVERPTFREPYTTTITENLQVGGSAMKVNADHPISGRTDDLRFELVGYPPSPYYFWIHPMDGDIMLRVKVYDVATPERASYQDIRINVTRNIYSPEFSSGIYNVDIYDTDLIGSIVTRLSATDRDMYGNVELNT
ncbi:FAT4-like protein, partial [Mya arenaria]